MGDEARNNRAKRSPRARRQKALEILVPLTLFALDGYILYAFCYEVVSKWVPSRGVRIAVYTLVGCLNFMMLVSYAAVHMWGPGRVDEHYARVQNAEEAFTCTSDGYAHWCSYCHHIKPARSHHSATLDYCVPVMDHYCIWLAAVVAQGNHKFFLQFVWYTLATMVTILVVLLRYQHRQLPHIAAQAIPVYVVCSFWLIFTLAVAGQHLWYIAQAVSTLDHMAIRKKRFHYFNIPVENGRRVLAGTREDCIPGPYNEGAWQNIVSVMGPIYTWPLPIRPPIKEPNFNPKLLETLRLRQAQIEKEGLAELEARNNLSSGPDSPVPELTKSTTSNSSTKTILST